MSEIREISGTLGGAGRRFAVVASRFNERVVDGLLTGAVDSLRRYGVAAEDVQVVRVPGAWEIPLALEELARAGGWDGLVALGAVIRGETAHFDYICAECSRGIAAVGERHQLPVGFGLLTCETTEQAEARSGATAGNKGREAAEATLEMATLLSRLRGEQRTFEQGDAGGPVERVDHKGHPGHAGHARGPRSVTPAPGSRT
ncbi:MAG: 6,7-dimethyl-8-ribityllumazine synthase [Acidobacteriota bacterium]